MSKKMLLRRMIASSTLAGVVALGAAMGYVYGNPGTLDPTPVVYKTSTAPDVTPEEAQRAVSSAKDLSTAFRVASDKVLPSVVTIETKPKSVAMKRDGNRRGRSQPVNPFAGTPFEEMLRGFSMEEFEGHDGFPFGGPHSMPSQGLGSGVVIDGSGLIMTNNHVVAGGENVDVLVRLWDGREFKAEQVWTDPKTDIAVVKIKADELVVAKMADSDEVAVGDWVLALGQPFGLESTVTAGIVSATHRGVGINARESFLQTDAAINPGNSGGPLVNLDGQIVGINTAISSRGGGNDGVGFAVPINLAKWVSDQLVRHGEVRRAYLGVGIQPVNATLAKEFNVKPREGVVVTDVYPDTPAAKSGLKSGDVIRTFAGVKVDSPRELQLLVERAELGRPHMMELVRNGRSMTLNFVPELQPGDFEAQAAGGSATDSRPSASSGYEALGLELSDLTPAVARQLGVKEQAGVVITDVVSGSLAARAGLESGMVITQINRQAVESTSQADKILSEFQEGDQLLLLVKSRAGSRFVAIGE